MTNEKKAAPAAKPVAAAKPPKKLIPRTAPKIEPTLDPILAEAAPGSQADQGLSLIHI